MESITKFKTELRKQKDIRQVPKHFEIGPRKLNIISFEIYAVSGTIRGKPCLILQFNTFCTGIWQ